MGLTTIFKGALKARKPAALKAVTKATRTAQKLDMVTGLPISEAIEGIGGQIINKQYGGEQKMYTPRKQKKSYLEVVLEEEIYKHGTKKASSKKICKKHSRKSR